MKTTRIYLTLEALTPIVHGDTRAGAETNETPFMRSTRIVDGEPMPLPTISDNALRSVMVRIPLHKHLLEYLEIEKVPKSVGALLFSGGNMIAGASEPQSSFEKGRLIRKLYPSIELLGGVVDNFFLPRSELRMSSWIICKEYKPAIKLVTAPLPDYMDIDDFELSVYDLLGEETRTRACATSNKEGQMIYTYETLAAGTKILVEFTLGERCTHEATSALATALRYFDGYIGAQGRQGKGRMAIRHGLTFMYNTHQYTYVPYLNHMNKNMKAMRDGLLDGTLGTGSVVCST